MFRLVCIIAALGSTAFAFAEPAEAGKLTEISLTRSGNAQGTGPEDVLILRSNGSASYVGKKNVQRLGLYGGEIPDHGFRPFFPLLEKMYASIHREPRSTGKPTGEATAIHWRILYDGKVEEVEDLCPGLDDRLWAFEVAVRGVAADIAWKPVDSDKAWPEQSGTRPAAQELKLAPAAATAPAAPAEAIAALTEREWLSPDLRNIVGAGSRQTLAFARQPDGGGITVHSVTRFYKSVNDPRAAPADAVEDHPCEVHGPVLWINGGPQTYAIDKDHLALNALVPVGGNIWYYAACDRDKDKKPVRLEEYRFEFIDDPVKNETGQVTCKIRSGDTEPRTDPMRFHLVKENGGMRFLKIEVDGPSGRATRAEIALPVNGKYGLMLKNPDLNTQVFSGAAGDK